MHLGEMSPEDVLALMASEEPRALHAVDRVQAELAEAARRVAETFLAGGRTVLLGAGTPGRLAIQEVTELPPTFGVPPERFLALVASRAPVGPAGIALTEDDTVSVTAALSDLHIGSGDAVIGIASSGRTPFVLAGIRAAAEAGAWTSGIANNAETPLLMAADLPILLDTGPELLTGSTRLKAGTAQKIALNRITTTAMVIAGRVRSNLMTELRGSNAKLRQRAIDIVSMLTGMAPDQAEAILASNDWHVGDTLRRLERRD